MDCSSLHGGDGSESRASSRPQPQPQPQPRPRPRSRSRPWSQPQPQSLRRPSSSCILIPWSSTWLLVLTLVLVLAGPSMAMRPGHVQALRQETVEMFYHGYDNYMRVAFPEDELRPVSCIPLTRDPNNPRNVELNDVLGNYSLTLIDSLSTLAIIASAPPDDRGTGPKALAGFQHGVAALVEQYGDGRPGPSGQGLRGRGFDVDSKVQVFETVIRGLGGLLSAHLFAVGELPITGYHPPRHPGGDDPLAPHPVQWPNGFTYDGQLLRLALDLGQRLLPAFYTKTGMPYPRVNLRHGIPFYMNSPLHDATPGADAGGGAGATEGPPEITETCSAGAGSLVLEFTVLSRLTGDPRFEQLAKRAFWAVWYRKSQIGLIGAGVDAEQGHWIGAFSVIGAGADSFFEYALKSHILLSGHELPNRTTLPPARGRDWMDPNTLFPPLSDIENSPAAFLEAWHHAHAAIKRHLYSERDHPHYENVNLWTGSLATNWVDSLGAYYSGLLVLAGEVEEAIETNLLYTAIWTRYSALPERWSMKDKAVEGGLGWWPLRPEFIESTYHLYRATKDPWYLYVGEMVLRDITRRCWTPCGWAGLQNVLDGEKSDRMESFFLGETAKYMYLLFDDSHPLNSLDAAYVFTTEGHPLIIPKEKARHKPRHSMSGHASRTDLTVYYDEDYTNTCPAPSANAPLTGSNNAARKDIFHAARMLDLHLLSDSHLGLGAREISNQPVAESNFTLYPWTLPAEMLPDNGVCSKVYQPLEITLEFASNAQQAVGGSSFNFMLGSQNLERLTADRIRVSSLSSLKITMRLEDTSSDKEWRVTKINGVPLGRDEFIVLDRTILGDISDPRFNLIRDPIIVKLQHLHHVDLLQENATDISKANEDIQDQKISPPESKQPEIDTNTSRVTEIRSLVKSLLNRVVASLDLQVPGGLPTAFPGSSNNNGGSRQRPSLPYNLVINQTAVTSTGVGSAPLPPVDVPAGARIPEFGPLPYSLLPWTTIYAAGDACAILPEAAPRDYQVIIIRRGGCSFSAKLAHIPAYKPSAGSLQLVVIVSDEGEDEDEDDEADAKVWENGGPDYYRQFAGSTSSSPHAAGSGSGLVRPLLDEVQKTPGGIQRRHPIAMVMVGGGDAAYAELAVARRVGVTRRYYIESQGVRVRNIIVDEAGAA
ncbi:glycosyl hydrolase family 47-domain-containing protein [Podospora appendiculata]|uniref:alpha-1,2-Mannosidase n=1 Tax=Podospora appendiculata TaxID=314037 RepID=A0AAE0XK51_9PEZI|nr:glycosyl hydrolase family 47-domain-containing protein [Podospora appendiculata]